MQSFGGFSMFSPTKKKSPSKTNFNGNDMHLSTCLVSQAGIGRQIVELRN